MLNRATRRVRSLRLRAPDEALVRRGALLLEDALRTASLPGGDGGRLLIVRSLAVGKIRGSQSPASLTLTIERRFRGLAAIAVHAEDPAAARWPAVFFRDDVEAHSLLAARLARRESVDAWFWPLAVSDWRPAMPRDEALRAVLYSVMQTTAGVAAVVAMIQALHERDALDGLLACLRREDGLMLSRAFGWSMSGLPLTLADLSRARLVEEAPRDWLSVVERWVAIWGGDETRSFWLAGLALVAKRSGRLYHPSLATQAERLLRLVAAGLGPPAPLADEKPKSGEIGPRLGDDSVETLHARSTLPIDLPVDAIVPTDRGAVQPPAVQAMAAEESPEQAYTDNAEPFIPTPDLRLCMVGRETESVWTQNQVRGVDISQSADRVDATPRWSDAPLPTTHAGLFFMLPIVERLGMASWLEANPVFTEADFPQQLLRYAAKRLGARAEDPVLAALPVGANSTSLDGFRFVAPAAWLQVVVGKGPWQARRVEGRKPARLLYDGSGRLALAAWHGRSPGEVRSLAQGRQICRAPAKQTTAQLAVALDAWLVATRRWCRRYAGFSLRDLVCRPGRVLATRTHVDMLFDYQQVDIRVRRVGLDLDPGWVPWLGRVVQFHYLYD